MNGLKIKYYCPVCKEEKDMTLTATKYMIVNGKSLAHIKCRDCNTELFVETADQSHSCSKATRMNMQVRDYTKNRFSDIIDRIFESGVYTESDSEEYIMNDVVKRLENETSVMGVSRHILSIKKYIELKMCSTFHNPCEQLKSYVVDNGIDKLPNVDKKYIYKKEDAQFDCCIYY